MSTSSKRTASPLKTGKPQKKPKLSDGSLESFWRQSPQKLANAHPITDRNEGQGQSKGKAKEEPIELGDSDEDDFTKGSIAKTQTELDEEFARALAEDEGIDIDKLRQHEQDEILAKSLAGDTGETTARDIHPPPVHPFFSPPAKASSPSKSKIKQTPVGKSEAQTPIKSPQTTTKMAFGSFTTTVEAPLLIYPLDLDIFAFQPSRDVDTTGWPRSRQGTADNLQVPYAFLTASFVLISATRSRLKIVTILTNTIRTIIYYQPAALLSAVYLITNHIAPAYEGVELGIGSQVLSKALKDVSGSSAKDLKALWNTYGDMGDGQWIYFQAEYDLTEVCQQNSVAFAAKSNVRTLRPTPPILVTDLYQSLKKIAGMKGSGQTNSKAALVQKFLVAAKGEETRFLMRTFVSHLRIGAVRLTVTAALARAFCLTRSNGRELDELNAMNNGSSNSEETVPDSFWIPVEHRQGVTAVARTVKEGKDDPSRLKLVKILAKAESLVRQVFVRHPNYEHIVPALLESGLENLVQTVPLTIGVPLSPMLGAITRDLGDVEKRLSPNAEFAAEYKYDGQRCQIHAKLRTKEELAHIEDRVPGSKASGGKWVGDDSRVYVRLFSRHLEDMTDKYPDILALIPNQLSEKASNEDESGVQSFILDAEICAIDPVTGELQNFQTLSNRARKDVNLSEIKVRVAVFAFDLMYLNGRSLLTEPFRRRRELMKKLLPPYLPEDPTVARFDHVKSVIGRTNDLESIRAFMEEAITQKCEGLMLKILDDQSIEKLPKSEPVDDIDLLSSADEDEIADKASAPESIKKGRRKALLSSYEPDKRADSWLKVKKDYGDIGDSLDLVPVGAWHGQGRKAGWWSPILLALYDRETDSYQAVCKCISGFTDQFYKDLNVRYALGSETCAHAPLANVDCGTMIPQVWWLPSEVWEIRGADITLSPVYPAAKGLIPGDRGCSLRFPRFFKIRTDKSIEQATTPPEFAEAYFRQESSGTKSETRTAPNVIKRIKDDADGGSEEDEEEEIDVLDDL